MPKGGEGGMSVLPDVIEQTSWGERRYDIFSKLFADRIIFLGEAVSDASANRIIAQMLYLEAQAPDEDIQLYINSPGGSVTAGLAIYDTMQYIRCDVSTLCVGMAASFGAFLLAGGTRGKRMALPNAEIMIHQPALNGQGIQGPASDIEIMAKYLLQSKDRLNRILAANTGHSAADIERDTDRDHFMSAEEALAYGLIDAVITKR